MNKAIRVATFSRGIYKKQDLITALLGADELVLNPVDSTSIGYVIGWGKKENTALARQFAKKNKLDYVSLEDGFIHSMGQGVLGANSCSLVKDKTGIYYDATQVSDLEMIILDENKIYYSPEIERRAKHAISRITQSNISKYNNAPEYSKVLPDSDKDIVLLIDQTFGDMSLECGYADKQTFDGMLADALTEFPDSNIIIKTHPDVVAGKKKGCFTLSGLDDRISVISELVNPLVLLKRVKTVVVATSQMGFEALMLGKRVICYGVPFYAGWGLTEDRASKDLAVWLRRSKKVSLEAIFSSAYIHYTQYLHPDTQKPCDLNAVVAYFELQKNNYLDLNKPLFCINFTRWKQNYIRAFLKTNFPLVFIQSAEQAIKKGFDSTSQLVTWASKNQEEAEKLVVQFKVPLWHIEDGFIRSTGLGTDLTAPASLVLDKHGIYYDPSKESDLELILETKSFSKQELERGEALRISILEKELSKYNLGSRIDKGIFDFQLDQKLILVPGQVEGDASIIKGCVDINSNADLIKKVKEKEPNAYLIFKPHPDVVSGNRKGKVDQETLNLCDYILQDASITDCLDIVDEVHTMTSLVGFEGLIRKLKVVCYGRPFYSGWGLTEDLYQLERRTRKLTLEQLVTATLIDYPLYINWQTESYTAPEVIVDQLKEQIGKQGGKKSNKVFWLKRQARKLKNIYFGYFR